jgi:hypothetical protein
MTHIEHRLTELSDAELAELQRNNDFIRKHLGPSAHRMSCLLAAERDRRKE